MKHETRVLSKFGQLSNLPRAKVERVDPSLAAAWLETSHGNRRISQEHVARLAEQMRKGQHQTTHQGIAFDCDNHLIDGHHTLWACLMSGTTISIMVTRNVRREAIRVIDTGKSRTLQDRLTLERTWGQVSRSEAACLRRMVRGRERMMKRSPSDEHADWRAHASDVRFAVGLTPGLTKIRTGTFRALIARAHKSVSAELLERFVWFLKNDGSLLAELRGMNDVDTYATVERALWSYCHPGEGMPDGDAFPLG